MKELVCALADRLPGFPWDRMPELYRVGPLGVPQSFKIQHGEWGPPCIRQSDIDWELYSVVLIGCDVLLSILFFLLARTISTVRIKWLSPTFRVSLGYIFGSIRLSMTIYFFRALPQAAYTYLHALSFFLHITIGLSALLFGDGPWKNLRPNDIGVFGNRLNPFKAIPVILTSIRTRWEYLWWGFVHRVSMLPGMRRVHITLAPAIDSGIEKIHKSMKQAFRTLSPTNKKSGSFFQSSRPRRPTPFPSDLVADIDETETLVLLSPTLHVPTPSKVTVVGPGKLELRVSQSKWNESVLFWAKPSIDAYFAKSPKPISPGKPSSPQSSLRLKRIDPPYVLSLSESSTAGVVWGGGFDDYVTNGKEEMNDDVDEEFEDGDVSSPTRATINIRGDGVLLGVTPAVPIVRDIVSVSCQNDSLDKQETKEFVVELLGRRMICTSGTKVVYTYGEYRRIFRERLPSPVKATLLWLLNKLNGNIKETNLRALRSSSEFDS